LRFLDEEIRRFEQYAVSPAYQTILAARRALDVNFSQQGYQNVVMMIADLRMQIEYTVAIEEWLLLNPPPPRRDRARAAGVVGGIVLRELGYGQFSGLAVMGGELVAQNRERRDQANYARRIELMQENLALYTAETGSPLGFLQSVPERQATNSAVLDELGRQISPYRNRQDGLRLSNEVNRLRSLNSRSSDAASQVAVATELADLRQQIEDFVAEQEAQHLENKEKLAELEEWLAEHQNQSQNYRNLTARIVNLRASNDRRSDVASQIATLERDIERFIEAPNQPVQQQRPPAQPRGGLLRR